MSNKFIGERDSDGLNKPSLARPRVEPTKRKRLSAKERSEILDRQNDCCAGCEASLVWAVVEGSRIYGPMIDEHIIPLELGGLNELSNRELRCVPCARKKTRDDIKRIAKTRRLIARIDGTRKLRKAIKGKGFSETLTRGFDGRVRRRETS